MVEVPPENRARMATPKSDPDAPRPAVRGGPLAVAAAGGGPIRLVVDVVSDDALGVLRSLVP